MNNNSHYFGRAYNNIGNAVNDLSEVTGSNKVQAERIIDKLEELAKEIQIELAKIKNS